MNEKKLDLLNKEIVINLAKKYKKQLDKLFLIGISILVLFPFQELLILKE